MTEAVSMRKLRQQRRRDKQCAQCGKSSNTYLCEKCKERREIKAQQRHETRRSMGLCERCGKQPFILDDERCLCRRCKSVYPNLPIRKLRRWEVKNHRLYHLMMDRDCSTKDLAKFVGISERSVCRWLFQNSIPKEDNARRAAQFFNMETSELFPGYNKLDKR